MLLYDNAASIFFLSSIGIDALIFLIIVPDIRQKWNEAEGERSPKSGRKRPPSPAVGNHSNPSSSNLKDVGNKARSTSSSDVGIPDNRSVSTTSINSGSQLMSRIRSAFSWSKETETSK